MNLSTFLPDKRFCRWLQMVLVCTVTALMAACNDHKPQHTVAIQQAPKTFATATLLKGKVSDKGGVIKTGSISLNDAQNHLIASTPLHNGHYQLEVPEHTPLPAILSIATTDSVLLSVIVDPSVSQYDINPLTTAIAKKAQALGGYTRANMVVAAESMINAPDANKTSTGFRGDPTTQYGGWH